ncbi:MAG: SPFH domain-containing protein [Deltaproteobacteria bacterium]|jgi:regulator of protease activity HflC (stomatin/prohibitin superfamily)|nr:SPFH domain-containing protein [Deltaproteobacteria bacterium]
MLDFLIPVFSVPVALGILWLCVVIVKQQTKAIIERFGKFHKIAEPGISLIIPFVDRVAQRVNLRVTQIDVQVETKTKDNVFVEMMVSVQFFIADTKEAVFDSFYKLDNPNIQIKAYVFDVVRAEVPKMDLDDVFENKENIAKAILESLQDTMTGYGYEIKQALITDINPDSKVKESMNRINAAKRDKEAATYEGEATRIRMVAEAQAEAESKKLQGQGTADQRIEIARGITQSVEALNKAGIDPGEATNTLLAVQYMDMMTAAAARSNSNVIMMPLAPSGGQDILAQLLAAQERTFDSKDDIVKF